MTCDLFTLYNIKLANQIPAKKKILSAKIFPIFSIKQLKVCLLSSMMLSTGRSLGWPWRQVFCFMVLLAVGRR